jgi:hypothetical protein
MTARVFVRFGEPISTGGEPSENEILMLRCLKSIAELAGRPDFKPQLAGRQWKPTPEELAEAMEGAGR